MGTDHALQLVAVYDDGEVVGVLPDGTGHLVMLPRPGKPAYVTRSLDDATGWRPQCSCGRWQTSPLPGNDHAEAEQVWEREHLAVLAAVAVVAEAHRGVEMALLALDDAVAAARTAGATWDAIGAAAGITRQSAHARWARRETGGRHR